MGNYKIYTIKALTMKTMKISAIIGFLLVSFPGLAQITPEKVYDYSLTSTRINQTEYKFYLMDVAAGQCKIYHTDHTLWKTITISLPANYYLFDIKFVTQNLFNSDADIELWYSAYEWIATGTSTGYYRYISKVVSENGNVLASIDGGAYAYIIQAGTDTYKLAVYAYDNSVSPYTIQTHIFSLPNPSSAASFVSAILADPYPNPASEYVNIPVNSDSDGGLLQVFSSSGQVVAENRIHGGPGFRLVTRGWSPGIYSFRIVKYGKSTEVKQFIVR